MTDTTNDPSLSPLWTNLIFAGLFFVFFQLLTGLVEATYTFGLLGTDIPPEIVFVLFLLTPLLLLIYPRVLEGRQGRIFTLAAAGVALLCWGASQFLDTRGKMIFCGVGTGAALLMLAGLVRGAAVAVANVWFGGGLGLAAMASIFLRATSSGNDISIIPGALAKLPLVVIFITAAFDLYRWVKIRALEESGPAVAGMGFWRTAGLCTGLFSALVIVYFGFASPTVFARWTGGSYVWITALTAVPLAVYLGALLCLPRFRNGLGPRLLGAWNLLFFLTLALTVASYSLRFPCCPSAYPFDQPQPGLPAQIALVLMLVLHPVIYLDAGLMAHELAKGRPAPRALAGGFALAALYLMVMIFAQVFTTVYDYIPVIGPWFRDQFDLVTAFPIALLVLATFLVRHRRPMEGRLHAAYLSPPRHASLVTHPFRLAIIGIIAVLAILIAAVTSAQPSPPSEKNTLRVLTYNIQQGYSKDGQKSFTAQQDVIRKQQADIVGLEESDTARIAGGNSDVVRYFADSLNMYSYYGPRTTTGTFGIALLSRYPIEDARTFFMYSTGEQTAAIQARIRAGGKAFTVLVTHLGNDGPLIQQQQVLQRLAGQANVIAMGDFNFEPTTEQYRLTTAALEDGWLAAETRQIAPGEDIATHIDHIVLSPGTRVVRAEYLASGPSDHPAMFAEIQVSAKP